MSQGAAIRETSLYHAPVLTHQAKGSKEQCPLAWQHATAKKKKTPLGDATGGAVLGLAHQLHHQTYDII